MRRKLTAAVAAGIFVAGASAQAAVLSGISGEVLVNTGQGYMPAVEGMEINPGDTVIANPGAQAQLSCGGGAIVAVTPGSVVTAGDCELAAGENPNSLPTPGSELIIGGLAVAGAVGLVVGLGGGKDKSASQ